MTNQPPSDWGQPTWGAKPSNRAGERGATAVGGPPPGSGPAPGTRRATSPPSVPSPPRPIGPQPQPARSGGLVTGAFGLLALMAAVVIGVFVLLVMWVVSMARGPIEATNSFVADLDEGRLPDAYASMCAQTKQTYSYAEFVEHMAEATSITGYTFVSASVRTDAQTMVSGTIDIDDEPRAIDFGLTEEGGAWKVCTYDTID